MATLISEPKIIEAVGTRPKLIQEFIGRMNSGTDSVSIARMESPSGWAEPGQTPQFDEYSIVLSGSLRVETTSQTLEVKAGQCVIAPRGEWVRYSSPSADGAEYIAICVPAFSPATVNRDKVEA